MNSPEILVTTPSKDYELIDSGDGEKLERFGRFVLSRPDPQALWPKRLQEKVWKKADGRFIRAAEKGDWSLGSSLPERWPVELGGLKFWVKPTAFKHTGLFPEQAPNWDWLRLQIERAPAGAPEILNLFGYTGGATLACARAGAKVTHIDGSKAAVTWAKDNAELSGLRDKPVRWIVEDARTFAEREIKRGRSYDGIIMDPPAFGHGPAGELWKIEEHFLPLIESCMKLLKPKPLFFLINGYSAGYSALAYGNSLLPLTEKYGGNIEIGELTIEEASKRLLPAGIFARWTGV
ncbi:MAG: class I SAM-dependent methyltransferase [Patescibacteria group bacterium]|nr:class I SAM-dependent methyltransferase [Patescibacteria group bacterium]